MADLLISGVELPEHDEILCLFSDGSLGLLDADYGFYPVRPIDCAKAVSLPEGHGKLIDADKLKKLTYEIKTNRGTYQTVINIVDLLNASTIVPAEGGEADGNS